ncbi:MAG: DNA polymerase/3'-5' exonuclease PolX [Candidatus Omnitrophota bacterium]
MEIWKQCYILHNLYPISLIKTMRNQEIAGIFNEIAELLEIKEENPFRIRAYRRAAQNISGLTEDIAVLCQKNRLENIPGIGRDLAGKIKEILNTNRLGYYEELKSTVPSAIIKFMTVSGIGPKTAKLIHEKLQIDTLDALEKYARANKIAGLPGIKEKTQENIIKGIELQKRFSGRMLLSEAMSLSEEIIFSLKKLTPIKRIEAAGSLRRKKETVRDIDILATSENAEEVMDKFTRLPLVRQILAKGETKSAIITKDNVQVDLRVVEAESFGAALCYFTGSKEHNIHLRDMAKRKGIKINEYGVFQKQQKRSLAGKDERDVYRVLGLSYIEPELREDKGEIEAAKKHNLPQLITGKDIRGDLHVHTSYSDGAYKLEDMVAAAIKRGYAYIAITDHSPGLGVAGGLKEKELKIVIKKIHRLNKRYKNFTILCGTEVDIHSDGTLDYPDEVLKELDLVIAAVHSGFKQSEEMITKRIITAMKNKHVHIIAHPSGRLLKEREPYALNWDEVIKAAADTNTALEINAYPKRQDLNDLIARRAREEGIKLAINTDAHLIEQLDFIKYGIYLARRAWCRKTDILNTLPVGQLLEVIKK